MRPSSKSYAGAIRDFKTNKLQTPIEDEDDDEYENDFAPNAERRTLPQPFDLLQHSFGDLADLARGQE